MIDETKLKSIIDTEIDNSIGIKEASGDMQQVSHTISRAKKGFRIWSGNDTDTLNILALGGYGVISVASHLVGKQIYDMIYSFLDGKTEKAAEIHRHLLPLVNALFVIANPIPVKYAVNQAGFRVGSTRLPLCDPDEKTAAQIMEVVQKYQIDLPV